MNTKTILKKQRDYFLTDETKNINFRILQLKKLKSVLTQNEELIYNAVYEDLGKSKFETYSTELAIIYSEIDFCIKNLSNWSKPKIVKTNLVNFPGRSFILTEPLGNILIIGAWNYPVQLLILPLVSNIAAGNTAILKPSELAQNTSKILKELINDNFPIEYIHLFEGGVLFTSEILKLKFDKIFFTGSTRVGKIVYSNAAENLTPVTLELGGKSPAIILDDSNLKISAKRIAWGKFLNSGQTCIAPDYVLIDEKIKNNFLNNLKEEIIKIQKLSSQVKIINKDRFERILSLINRKKIYFGGGFNKDKLIIEPTILQNITFNDKVMKEEIFGPILPIISFNDLNEIILKLKKFEKPLSLYLFTNDKKNANKIFSQLSFGGGAINDTIMHVANSNLPFGGVGSSGIGAYHGEAGYLNFSHQKSIIDKPTWFEPFIKHPPVTKLKFWLMKKVFK